MAADCASRLAVAALQKLIDESKIRIQVKFQVRVDLNRLWESIVCADANALKRKGWIVNCTLETVEFYVYNANALLRWIPNHRIHAQPGEKIEVHGSIFQRKHENMVVKKDNRGIAYNIKRNCLYFWTGSAMIEQVSSIECFKNKYHDHREQYRLLQRNMKLKTL